MKQHLTTEYFKWLFFKASTQGLIILSVYFIMIEKDQNILLGISLFVLSMLTFSGYHRIKPTPLLATCLDKSGFFANIYTTLSITTGLGFLLLVSIFGIEDFNYDFYVVSGICCTFFASGVTVYIYNCKKNGVLDENV